MRIAAFSLGALLLAGGCTTYVHTEPAARTVETKPPAKVNVDIERTPRTAERPGKVNVDVDVNR